MQEQVWKCGTKECTASRCVTHSRSEWSSLTFNIHQAGVNGFLDVARKTYQEATDDIHEEVKSLNGGTTGPNMINEYI